jgi:hypothetical protein
LFLCDGVTERNADPDSGCYSGIELMRLIMELLLYYWFRIFFFNHSINIDSYIFTHICTSTYSYKYIYVYLISMSNFKRLSRIDL